jgi:hypothetical protein
MFGYDTVRIGDAQYGNILRAPARPSERLLANTRKGILRLCAQAFSTPKKVAQFGPRRKSDGNKALSGISDLETNLR